MEFKKLSEVAVVEKAGDTANVLIEDAGVIKRVPKTEVGGNGSNQIVVTAEVSGGSPKSTTFNASNMPTFSINKPYAEIIEMFNDKTIDLVIFKGLSGGQMLFDPNSSLGVIDYNNNTVDFGFASAGNEDVIVLMSQNLVGTVYLLPDNTVSLENPYQPSAN